MFICRVQHVCIYFSGRKRETEFAQCHRDSYVVLRGDFLVRRDSARSAGADGAAGRLPRSHTAPRSRPGHSLSTPPLYWTPSLVTRSTPTVSAARGSLSGSTDLQRRDILEKNSAPLPVAIPRHSVLLAADCAQRVCTSETGWKNTNLINRIHVGLCKS